jgi:hypothetical protein
MIEENNGLTDTLEKLQINKKHKETTFHDEMKKTKVEVNSHRQRMESDLQEHLRIFESKIEEERSEMHRQMGE